jgi:hypothetical protein
MRALSLSDKDFFKQQKLHQSKFIFISILRKDSEYLI